jgi:8-oxo-dGTP pyrophosphatase MutT (NUDIX family)
LLVSSSDTDAARRGDGAQREETGKRHVSYGGVLIDERGRILVRKPAGEYDGYVWTFPKGGPEPGDTPEAAALREVREETGYRARIIGKVPGAHRGHGGVTEYFLMRPEGEPAPLDDGETDAVRWVTPTEARRLLAETRSARGRERDFAVLDAALAEYARIRDDA